MAYLPQYPIETERLLLRPFSRGDVEAVYAYRQRADVARHLFDEPMSREQVTEAVQARIGQTGLVNEGDKVFLAVETREPIAMIGEVSLILCDLGSRQAEIGYIFNPDWHGRGYATEAARALLAMAFDGAGMHRVFARCAAANAASWRLMERIGMRREAHFHEHVFVKGAWDEELIYALLEQDWRAA
jgi:RimJ/RimL family protein N-acetyltransferase